MGDSIRELLADLTGRPAPFDADPDQEVSKLMAGSGVGYSQINELLLLLGYDRISSAFFAYLVDGKSDYSSGTAILSRSQFRAGVDRFMQLAALRYGSIKIAFGYLSTLPPDGLNAEIRILDVIPDDEYTTRHDPVVPVTPIPGDKTYYLGYIVDRELKNRLAQNPDDEDARREVKIKDEVVAIGKRNHEAYLASDHMDVYVATSMRERHEYQIVNKVISAVFAHPGLTKLKLRCFDPTQAYCADRIDKGLAEGLMLKRAKCTLYLAQEADTLGKDSELASTLAQGKPVVAYIPTVRVGEEAVFVDELLAMIRLARPDVDDRDLVLGQLRVFAPEAAWNNADVMRWINDKAGMDMNAAKATLGVAIRTHYDKRADTLKSSHPLGIQVNLETGVANGVLVARSTDHCAEVIQRVLTNRLEFRLERAESDGNRYLKLVEVITGSIFRVVTGDQLLTNAFWNFYVQK
ncbi:MAG TPA: hypothetical protein VH370_21060 [Humisphaera sp.]|jgi:hypothetical protein|nr:hypothetical protein [Humisphaera sp.]